MNPTVLVIGAGPVGLTLALELARYGISVRIVDRALQRTDKSKALVLWSRTLELLDRSGQADAFVAAGLRAGAANLMAGPMKIARITFDHVASPHPYALMLPQSETERLLEAALGRVDVTVERGVEASALVGTGQGASMTLRHPDGRSETVQADWLVGCDGAHSTVRHAAGMAFEGTTLASRWILADVHAAPLPWSADELQMVFHGDGILAFFPIVGDRCRLIADVGVAEGAEPGPGPTLADVQAVLDRRGPGGIVLSDPVWISSFHINERKVAAFRAARVFVAGDAAHVHSPAGGQGMNTGMQDAFNLAWKLALVARGTGAGGPLLDSYSMERSAVAAQVLADTGRLTAMATLKNHAAQALRNHAAALLLGLTPMRRRMADTFSEITIGYPHSPLTRSGPHGEGPAAGERAAPRAGEACYGAGDRPRFALLAEAGEAATGLIARFPDLLEPAVRPPFDQNGLWLVRPDGYVGLKAGPDGWSEAGDYLAWLSAA